MTAASAGRQRGFTLIEVLVALALMALVSLISWRALDVVERSSERLNASADDTLAIVRALGQIERDIGQRAGGDILPAIPAGAVAAPAAVLPPGIRWLAQQGATPVLALVRAAGDDGAWQQVYWRQEGDTLLRAAGPAAYRLPLPEPGRGDVVLDHVRQFTVRAWLPGRGWSALPAPANSPTATGLEIVIERQRNDRGEPYRKVVLLP